MRRAAPSRFRLVAEPSSAPSVISLGAHARERAQRRTARLVRLRRRGRSTHCMQISYAGAASRSRGCIACLACTATRRVRGSRRPPLMRRMRPCAQRGAQAPRAQHGMTRHFVSRSARRHATDAVGADLSVCSERLLAAHSDSLSARRVLPHADAYILKVCSGPWAMRRPVEFVASYHRTSTPDANQGVGAAAGRAKQCHQRESGQAQRRGPGGRWIYVAGGIGEA